MKNVVISCGPIPSKLDSVKYITNRFKGGLAFKTAKYFIDSKKYDVTIVMWRHTSLPHVNGQPLMDYWAQDNVHIVTVDDVVEYYNWFKDNAANYDAFILAAAVANLMPSTPWQGKFPSHNYKVGEKFNIQFEIAPRAIDIIKKVNPRCTLIGYKLFDTDDENELVEIARHTLADAKANIIFANTPKTAKLKKLAVMADNSVVPCNFDEHIELIERMLDQEYFKTKVEPLTEAETNDTNIRWAMSVVKMYDKTFNGFGTVAVPVGNTGMFVTTSRGHRGEPVLVRRVDFSHKIVNASGKATLNAPTLAVCMRDNCVVVHRHYDDPLFKKDEPCDYRFDKYLFPGTKEEAISVKDVIKDGLFKHCIWLEYHGDLSIYPIADVDWTQYYEDFPKKYFSTPEDMQKFIDENNSGETLELGSNKNSCCKYSFDLFAESKNAINLNEEEVFTKRYDLVVAKNSINYFSKSFIERILDRTNRFIGNTFLGAPDEKVSGEEAAILDADKQEVIHTLHMKDDSIACHKFNNYTKEDYEKLGLEVRPYGRNSALVIK